MMQNQEEISIDAFISDVSASQSGIDCIGLSGSSSAYLACRLFKDTLNPLLIVVPTTKDAEKMMGNLHFFSKSPGAQIRHFPAYNISPFRPLAYSGDLAAKRIDTLYRLFNDRDPCVVVTTIGALLQKVIPKQALVDYAELLITGEEIDRDLLIEKLVSGGYARSALVEEPGDFSIRGGILDVFSPMYPDPLRIELFGDMVDSIRSFSAVDQRRMRSLQEAVILPAREAILRKEHMIQIIGRVRREASLQGIPVSIIRDFVDRIKNEGVFPGIERLLPMIYSRSDTLIDYVPAPSLFLLIEPRRLKETADDLWHQALQHYETARDESRLCSVPESLYMRWSAVKSILARRKSVAVDSLPISKGNEKLELVPRQATFSIGDNSNIRIEIEHRQEKEILFLPLIDWIKEQSRQGYGICCVCSTRSQADRLVSLLSPYGIQLRHTDSFSDLTFERGHVYVCIGQLSSGFVWPSESLAIITEDEIFGSKHHRRTKARSRPQTPLMQFEDLKKGDFIVHLEHGIGRYEGLVKLRLDGSTNDFLLVVYREGDKLYLPVDRMSMVQKYIGVDGILPHMDKLGGVSWDRVKGRVKKSTEKIAGELLRLYAARKVERGHAFQPADSYFQEFEAGFAYEETADQLMAIEAVLQDMKQPTPMDRLICGDVGYGKTEVALRAAFLAINDGKQVAVLVPTTVLAEQHFATFTHRFERYPVNIECLSRFRSPSEQRKILEGLASGTLDIVIGTHRLLQKDISFRDLQLVILDEEQRFGVKDKEKLKEFRKTVDVLALTATPIPRTLHMSLLGVRDISIISTPPEQRQAIITYLSEFDETTIREAIENELNRNGQIFFVHNNINSIRSLANRIQELAPRVRLGIAHGRLKEDALERVMLQFVNKEIDLLVCTTIVESGLDIPAANTILINRADKFGLAQMYQLRGRVGRAEEQAYAYLFIPKDTKLGKDAQKRLKVLMEYSDLGSGFQIAMSDLKIRGGGTILGDEQSGHIAAVGYDMFLSLMAESVAELKGEPIHEPLDPEINVAMSAYIPASYIPDIDQRLMIYRRLAKLSSLEGIMDLREELSDRFGALPSEGVNLLSKIMLKILSVRAGVKRLDMTDRQLLLHFSEAHLRNPFGITDMVADDMGPYEFTDDHIFKVSLSSGSKNHSLVQTKNILKEIAQRVNS